MSMKPWNSILVKYFTTIKILDDEIEKIRVELCQNPSFFPKILFNIIDSNEKNFITLDDLKTYLKNNNIPYEEYCLRRFIHNFDKDNDFSIDYNEFLGIVLSKRNSSLSNNVMYRENKDNKLENIVENSFNKLLIKELNLVKNLISIADELKYSKEFTTYEAYISIVKEQKYITQENLANYLRENNFELDNIDPIILMFRIDADNDGQISYEEFQEIFFPYKSNYSLNDVTINKSLKINYDKRNLNNELNNKMILPNQNSNKNYYKLKTPNNKFNEQNNIDNNLLNKFNISYDYSIGQEENFQNYNPSITNFYKTKNSSSNNFNKYQNELSFQSINDINNKYLPQPIHYQQSYQNNLNQSNLSSQTNVFPNNNITQSYYSKKDYPQNNYFKSNYLYNNYPLNFQNEYPQNNYSLNYNSNNNYYLNNQIPINYNSEFENNISPDTFQLSNQPENMSSCPHNNISPCESCCQIQKQFTLLASLLNDIVIQGNIIENAKESLSFCTDVNLTNLYQFFDYNQRNSISSVDISQALKELNVFLTINDIKILFRGYDKNLDGRFDYDEFCNIFLPKKYSLAKLFSERTPNDNFKCFSNETNEIIINVIRSIIDGEKSNEKIRFELNMIPGFNSFDLFNKIKKRFCAGIYKEDIISFMESYGRFLQPFEIKMLIDILDKDNDGIISYNEFMIELMPKI